jgi:hypothetical protein
MSGVSKVCRTTLAPGVRPVFPPHVVVRIKALACELPAERGVPLSRFSMRELADEAVARGIVASSGRPFGGGSVQTLCAPGVTAAGYFLENRISRRRPAGCWISTTACGVASR